MPIKSHSHRMSKQVRKRDDPWVACQRFAWDAWRATDSAEFDRLIRAAIKSQSACPNAYKRSAVAAWPLRAMLERDQTQRLDSLLNDALSHASEIEPPVGKADALFLLWQAVYPSPALRLKVLAILVSACYESESWKGLWILCDVVLITASNDPAKARELIMEMPDGKHKRSLVRKLDKGESSTPRRFF